MLRKEPLIETLNQLRIKYGDSIIDRAGEKMTKIEHQNPITSETSFSKDFLDFFAKNK